MPMRSWTTRPGFGQGGVGRRWGLDEASIHEARAKKTPNIAYHCLDLRDLLSNHVVCLLRPGDKLLHQLGLL